jgi:hypothetical protein
VVVAIEDAAQLPMQIEKLIVGLKKEHPHWGAPKIREKLRRLYPDTHCPAINTHALSHQCIIDRSFSTESAESCPSNW